MLRLRHKILLVLSITSFSFVWGQNSDTVDSISVGTNRASITYELSQVTKVPLSRIRIDQINIRSFPETIKTGDVKMITLSENGATVVEQQFDTSWLYDTEYQTHIITQRSIDLGDLGDVNSIRIIVSPNLNRPYRFDRFVKDFLLKDLCSPSINSRAGRKLVRIEESYSDVDFTIGDDETVKHGLYYTCVYEKET